MIVSFGLVRRAVNRRTRSRFPRERVASYGGPQNTEDPPMAFSRDWSTRRDRSTRFSALRSQWMCFMQERHEFIVGLCSVSPQFKCPNLWFEPYEASVGRSSRDCIPYGVSANGCAGLQHRRSQFHARTLVSRILVAVRTSHPNCRGSAGVKQTFGGSPGRDCPAAGWKCPSN